MESEQLTAVVQDTPFRNDENGYTVLRVTVGRTTQTVVGQMPELSPGENVTFEGSWTEHPAYGKQFHALKCTITPPTGKTAIEKYLGSGLIRGIGPSTAKLIVRHFGENALEILDEHPERLTEVSGIGKKKAAMILESYAQQMGMRRVLVFLQNYGISPNLAMHIAKYYGENTVELVRENPYRMVMDIDGVGFLTADRIALSMGMDPQSEFRIRAALFYLLSEAANSAGHTYLPRELLLERAAAMLHAPAELVDAQISHALLEKMMIGFSIPDCENALCLPLYYLAESEIALRLTRLMHARPYKRVQGLNGRIAEYEKETGVSFSQTQRKAIRSAVEEGVLVITGGPGTGKTTTVNAILQLLENQAERVALCAPTGRAAKRLSELTGRKASTIHRLLEVDYTGGVVSFIHNDKNLLKCDVVILDEMSMVDVKLFQALVTALRYSCRIIMVGDADQLPSVGPGNLLGEIIRSGCVPTVCLNEIFRQAKRSLIVENAHHIICGEPLQKGGKTDDFFFLEADGDAAQKLVCDLVTTRLPRSYGFDPVRDIQVLCPTKLGPTGTQALNVELQNLLNPEQKGKPQLQSAARVFRVGDKVMQVRNNYEIVWQRIGGEQGVGAYNGDIGIVESINTRERSMVVRMDDRRLVYPAENLNELEIAYAITVHKSQGSEFPAVILPVAQVPPRLCYRNLFYTGVTRARKLCIVAGRRDVANRMMSNVRQNLRYSGLCALLQAELPPEQVRVDAASAE